MHSGDHAWSRHVIIHWFQWNFDLFIYGAFICGSIICVPAVFFQWFRRFSNVPLYAHRSRENSVRTVGRGVAVSSAQRVRAGTPLWFMCPWAISERQRGFVFAEQKPIIKIYECRNLKKKRELLVTRYSFERYINIYIYKMYKCTLGERQHRWRRPRGRITGGFGFRVNSASQTYGVIFTLPTANTVHTRCASFR